MASITSLDELNNISSTSTAEKAKMSQIRQYFEEMELDDEEIEKRISLADDLETFFRRLFLLMLGASVLESYGSSNTLESQKEYYYDYAHRGYSDEVVRNGYATEDEMYDENTYLGQYTRQITRDIVDTTILHIADEYYWSMARSINCALNETNAVANYRREIDAIKMGKKYKTWVTKRDNRVRHSHVMADGETIGIFDAFQVGDSEMMFPLDRSLGADEREIIRCRCVCRYFR